MTDDTSENTDNLDNADENTCTDERKFTQAELNSFLAAQKLELTKGTKKATGSDPAAETLAEIKALKAEMEKERSAIKFERWATSKGADERVARLLTGVVDLADSETWQGAFDDYADLFKSKARGNLAPPENPIKGAPNGQPSDERPRIGKSIDKDKYESLSPKETEDYVRKMFNDYARTKNKP